MKIAYVTTYDPSDIHAWSGTVTYMLKALQGAGFQTETIGKLRDKATLFLKMKNAFYSKMLSKDYLRDREPVLLKSYASQAEKALSHINCDVVFSPGSITLTYLKTEYPIVFWTDSSFAGMVNFYPGFSNLCAETIRYGNKMEQIALSKCHLAIYASDWAANTAIQNYDVNPEKVKVVPFGANLTCNRKTQDIEFILHSKTFEPCKLLFIGVEWFRKGGDIAVRVAGLLNQRGIRTELHIVGCNPPVSLPGYVKRHGFISKTSSAGRRFLDKLMIESHFLILPSRAECFGLVFPEASSFGLPSLATRVGGIPTAIHDGKNGQTFPLDGAPEKYCDYIERMMSSKREYYALALSSFREFSERLNWISAGNRVQDLISDYCR